MTAKLNLQSKSFVAIGELGEHRPARSPYFSGKTWLIVAEETGRTIAELGSKTIAKEIVKNHNNNTNGE